LRHEITHALLTNPNKSNGVLAGLLECSPQSVARVRARLEEAGAIGRFIARAGRPRKD
jgi:DNA-binding Lrp family transcriptional regulator